MKEKPKKPGKKKDKAPEPQEVELTPKQLKEKRREEARARAEESRKVVAAGTTAWTGKLPAQLLNEYCQKLKWERVDYPVKGSGEYFTGSVIVARKNPKTKQVDKVRLDPPPGLIPPQKTALEARHMSATYGLHRISSHRNWKMMLPPLHRDIWVQLDEIKAQARPNEQWKWQEDPFQAEIDRSSLLKDQKEQREKREQEKEQRQLKSEIESAKAPSTLPASKHKIRFNSILKMSRHMREIVEATIRQNGGFKFSTDDALDPKAPKYAAICATLEKLGFSSAQVKEALEYSRHLTQALAWLLIHVPEDDLPKIFIPTALANTVRISSEIKVESAAAKIREFGYSSDLARQAVIGAGSAAKAMVRLTHQLAGVTDQESTEDIWDSETETLKAIYDTVQTDHESCELQTHGLTVCFYKSIGYPNSIPGIGVKSETKVPKYVLLDTIKRACEHARDLEGDYMLLSIAQWIEDNFDSIVKAPNKLAQISSGVTGVKEDTVSKPKLNKSRRARPAWKPLDSKELETVHRDRFSSAEGKSMLKSRAQLPAWHKQNAIVDLIHKHQVVVITGETGSGKSTQVVQFLLDHMIVSHTGGAANIICTQPRRISAIGVAQRVAEERVSRVGDQVGYVTRGESKLSSSTQIRFVTGGVLLRILQTDPAVIDSTSHIVIDEVHERSLDNDFLLILLKRICERKKSIKVVLMSATVDPAQFIQYFESTGTVGYTHIEGRTFPVDKIYLDRIIPSIDYVPEFMRGEVSSSEVGKIIGAIKDKIDYRLVAQTVNYINEQLGSEMGSILVFMPGAAEIDRTIQAISQTTRNTWTLPLHASLAPSDQKLVFESAPRGKRKVIVCTNVAETSITIADAVAVIDSGRVKETIYDPHSNVVKLVDMWVSQASATQRMGRAGRVRAGKCYKLYTLGVETDKMRPRPAPEILRAPLESLYLSIKAMGISNVEEFLNGAIDVPDTAALETARQSLLRYGALDSNNALTPLGKHISLLPTDPRTGKCLVLGAILGCLPACLTVAAIITGKPPFFAPKDQREAAKAAAARFGEDSGDLLAGTAAYNSWLKLSNDLGRSELRQWCADNFVSHQVCREITSTRRQLLSNLMQAGFVPTDREQDLPSETRMHTDNVKLVRAVIGGALAPNLTEIVLPDKTYKVVSAGVLENDPESQKIRYFTPFSERVFVHPGSTMFGSNKYASDTSHMSYSSSIVSTKHFIAGVTPLSIYGFLFFSNLIEVDPLGAGVVVDRWSGLKCWPRIGLLVQFLKNLFSELLERKFADPSLDLLRHPILSTVHMLIDTDGRATQIEKV